MDAVLPPTKLDSPGIMAKRKQNNKLTKEHKDGMCRFYLRAKGRYCYFQVVTGEEYCGNHLHQVTNKGPKHVPCPVDPTQ